MLIAQMFPYEFQSFDMVRKWLFFICARYFTFCACYSRNEDTKQQEIERKNNHVSHDQPAKLLLQKWKESHKRDAIKKDALVNWLTKCDS